MPELNLDLFILDNNVTSWIFSVLFLIGIYFFRTLITKLILSFLIKLSRQKIDINSNNYKNIITSMKRVVMLFGIIIAFEDIKFPDLINFEISGINFSTFVKKIIHFIIIISFVNFINSLVDYFSNYFSTRASKTESKLDDQLIPFATDFLKIFIIIIGILAIIGNIFEVNITALAAGLGVGGIAIAMASKESLENLFGSFTIFLDQPFTVGDIVTIGAITGVVEKVGFRSTRIRTFDKSLVTVPNKKMIDLELDNLGERPVRRCKFNVGITYNTSSEDIKKIVQEIQNAIDNHTMTTKDGKVRFMEFGNSSLDIMVLYYVKSADWDDYINTKENINYIIMEIVRKYNSDFAFPSQSIYIENESNKP